MRRGAVSGCYGERAFNQLTDVLPTSVANKCRPASVAKKYRQALAVHGALPRALPSPARNFAPVLGRLQQLLRSNHLQVGKMMGGGQPKEDEYMQARFMLQTLGLEVRPLRVGCRCQVNGAA